MSRVIGIPRVLPVLIIVASAALVVRVAWIGHDLVLAVQDVSATASVAEAAPPLHLEVAGKPDTEDDAVADDGAEHGDPQAEHETVGGEAASAAAGVAGDTVDAGVTPDARPALSAAEIEVLQQLAKRRDALAAREGEIDERAALLEAAEARIEQKVQEFKELRATLEDLIRSYEEQEDGKVRSLVKIYENMKPRDAARIFEELEMETVLLVADRMKERKLAPIMATMNPGKAKEVTVELARQRELPASMRLRAEATE